jgi:hypothetical protein
LRLLLNLRLSFCVHTVSPSAGALALHAPSARIGVIVYKLAAPLNYPVYNPDAARRIEEGTRHVASGGAQGAVGSAKGGVPTCRDATKKERNASD